MLLKRHKSLCMAMHGGAWRCVGARAGVRAIGYIVEGAQDSFMGFNTSYPQ